MRVDVRPALLRWARERAELSQRTQARRDSFFLRADASVLPSLATVSHWATGQNYEPAAVSTFLQTADYYLVAQAHAGRHSVVTHEVPSGSFRKIKIPDACIGLGIRCITEMLRGGYLDARWQADCLRRLTQRDFSSTGIYFRSERQVYFFAFEEGSTREVLTLNVPNPISLSLCPCFPYCLTSSTRRFWARASSVSLPATGLDAPNPAALSRVAAMPAALRKSVTDWARCSDKVWL